MAGQTAGNLWRTAMTGFGQTSSPVQLSPIQLTRRHLTRLRQIHRSSGWPCHDGVEVIVAGLVESVRDSQDRETLRLTPAGLERLAGSLSANRSARDAHEALV